METKQRWVLGLTSLASLMVMLDMLVVTTALREIQRDLGASLADLEWTISAYTLTFAVLLMTGAALGDRFGRRRVVNAGIAVFTLASVGCALAPDTAWLIADRAVQGAGSALITPNAMALLSAAFAPQHRARALGIFSSITGLATLGGPLVGGAVVEGLAWQWIFWLSVPIGLLLVPLVRAHITESERVDSRLDGRGLVLVSGAAFGVVWGLIRGNAAGWTSAEVVASLVTGIVFGAAFVAWERHAIAPMIPLEYFRIRAFSAGNLAAFLLYGSVFGTAFFLAQFLQVALLSSPLEAGLQMLPWTVTLFVVAPVAGAKVRRYGERPFIVGGLALQALGFGLIGVLAEPDVAYSSLIVPMMIAGIGVSAAMPAAQNAVLGAVPPTAVGKAAGTVNVMRQLGGTFGIAVLAAVFAHVGGYSTPSTMSAGFGAALYIAAVLSLSGAIIGLGTDARRRAVAAVPAVSEPARA